MRDDAADVAGERYDRLAKLFGGTIPEVDIKWEDMLKKRGSIDAKRKRYHAQPALKALKEIQDRKNLDKDARDLVVWIDMGAYGGGREAYVGRAIRDAICTFAVVKDGKWYERGKMGWWACVADEKDGGDWAGEVRKLLDSVSDNTLISVYDCHI
jgi:hypothetical protein